MQAKVLLLNFQHVSAGFKKMTFPLINVIDIYLRFKMSEADQPIGDIQNYLDALNSKVIYILSFIYL